MQAFRTTIKNTPKPTRRKTHHDGLMKGCSRGVITAMFILCWVLVNLHEVKRVNEFSRLATLAVKQECPRRRPLQVFLLAGQSNMGGTSKSDHTVQYSTTSLDALSLEP